MLVNVTIKGISAILQHRFAEAAEEAKPTRRVNIKRGDPRTEAEKVCYRNAEGGLWFPGAAITRLLREAGAAHKQVGSRKSIKFVVPSAILVAEEQIPFHDDDGQPITEFEVDSRAVVIPATKGRVMRHRPRLNNWCATFDLEVDEDVLEAEVVHQLLVEGGTKIGLGDFRPEKGGPFGRFRVVTWAEIRKVDVPELRKAA